MDSQQTPASTETLPTNAQGVKHKGEGKTARIPIKVVSAPMLRKAGGGSASRRPPVSTPRFGEIKKILRARTQPPFGV